MSAAFPADLVERLGALFGELPDAVRLLDSRGGVVFRNEASRLLAPDGLGHLCGQPGGQRNPSCPACQIDEVLERGTFLRWHVSKPRAEDSPDYFEITLNPVRAGNDRIVGVLEIVRDATATLGLERYLIDRAESQEVEIRQRSEEASRLSSELGQLRETQVEILESDRLRAMNQLIAGISHEIHTPLGAMLSSADMLSRGLEKAGAEARQCGEEAVRDGLLRRMETVFQSARLMVESARRIQAVVRTLQLFSQLDGAATQKVDLREGIDTGLGLLQYRAGERIRIVKKYGQIPKILCRPDALNQVFMNLMLNAVQAIEAAGTIEIVTRRVEDEVWIEISDDGVGIPDEHVARVFDLGFTTKQGRGGAGIGLALTWRIVREHDGLIEVSSRPGKGTKFTVRLPIKGS